MATTIESQFGPPSEAIDVALFLQSTTVSHPNLETWSDLTQDQRLSVETECSTSDIAQFVKNVVDDPRLFSHATKSHQITVGQIYDTAEISNKRKRKRATFPDPESLSAEVTMFQKELDAVQLRSASLTLDSALFMRTQKISDHNAFKEVKVSSATTSSPPMEREALIILTIYNRLAWDSGRPSRLSQHAVLGRQTLQDLFDIIPCVSKEFSEEMIQNDQAFGYEKNQKASRVFGSVICIGGLAYSDHRSSLDYADGLLNQTSTLPSEDRTVIEKARKSLSQTTFDSLVLHLNEPYWLLHQGNCEHFIVIEQIRLRHNADPPNGYPLTLQVTPPLLDLCRACSKVPAVWSIVGDVRLGESPCVLCAPCWRSMGQTIQNQGVIAVSLPKYVSGWSEFH